MDPIEAEFRIDSIQSELLDNVTDEVKVLVKFDPENEDPAKRYTIRLKPTTTQRGEGEEDPPEVPGCPFPPGCTP